MRTYGAKPRLWHSRLAEPVGSKADGEQAGTCGNRGSNLPIVGVGNAGMPRLSNCKCLYQQQNANNKGTWPVTRPAAIGPAAV